MSEREKDLDRHNACMRQAELADKRFNDRRPWEWRVTFGFWTLIVLGFWYFKEPLPILVVLLLPVLYALFVLWTFGLWKANQRDKQRRDYFVSEAEKFLRSEDYKLEKDNFQVNQVTLGAKHFVSDYSAFSQAVFTALLLLLLLARGLRR